MLLNELLKEHRKVEEQEATITQLKSAAAKQELINAQQQKGMDALAAMVNAQASQIQKVSAQLEVSKPAPQTVNNP
jgi:uncharacterized coiled-coil protein SlyX